MTKMIQRSSCIYNGEVIGIESIYTVINGKQINIPDKVEALRKLGREGKLLCTCGCGAKLLVVASERIVRRQHFRLMPGGYEQDCHLVEEGQTSIDSKIVLKCWFEDKLKTNDIEVRVPINYIDDIKRKYEYSHLSRSKKIAISYYHDKVNISDEKIDILESNRNNINIIYIVDWSNGDVKDQYPEHLMKIQAKQGYVLYLRIDRSDYFKAHMEAVYYVQNIDGLWEEISFANDMLSKFDVSEDGMIAYDNILLVQRKEQSIRKYLDEQENLKLIREQEELRREEIEKQRTAENKRREEKRLLVLKKEKEEAERNQAKAENLKRLEKERKEREENEKRELFFRTLEQRLNQQEEQVRDPWGDRWIRCRICGKASTIKDFWKYGGTGTVNIGTCYECGKNTPNEAIVYEPKKNKQKYNPNICPECGGKLVRRSGRSGPFMGCKNYPKCWYTRSIKK